VRIARRRLLAAFGLTLSPALLKRADRILR